VADALAAMVDAGGGEVVVVPREPGMGAHAVRLEVLPGHVTAAVAADRGARRLAALGWRRPAAPGGPWHQYLYPQRRRDHRAVGEWVQRTLREAHGAGGRVEVLSKPRAGAADAMFAGPSSTPTAADLETLGMVERVLSTAAFHVTSHEAHLEAGAVRRHLRVHLCVYVVRGTLSVHALHLVEPDAAAVAAHVDANAMLDAAPFTYALGSLAGGRRAVCLQAKLCAPPAVLAISLWSLIEPLLAAQRRLRSSSRR
jgi:hypothetical protein